MALIVKTNIQQYREVSSSVPDKKINPFIDDAELLDLCPLLGEAFYSAIADDPASYTDLLDPKTYTYSGNTYKSPGLRRVLVDFAYARYTLHGSQTDTPFGRVEKQYKDGAGVSRTDKKEVYKLSQQTAMQYWSSVRAYLDRKAEDYPLWGADCYNQKRGSFRFSKITRD